MKPFESFLAATLEDYIGYRKSLGYTDKHLRAALRPFDRYLLRRPSELAELCAGFILEFKSSLTTAPRSLNNVLSALRGFFNYLVRKELIEHNPLQDIPTTKPHAFIPFVFSARQTDQLLSAVQRRIRREPTHFFADLTVHTAILLLARCALRLSEPLRLKCGHYLKEQGCLIIEKTKFSKDRLIPLPKQVIDHLDNYLAVRTSLFLSAQNPYLLPGSQERMLSKRRIYEAFYQAVRDIGINAPRRIVANTVFGAPTPHSLRHSFAINTLKQIRARGQSPQAALPVLATFMGHRKYRYTAVYLKVLDAEKRQHLVDFSIEAQKDI